MELLGATRAETYQVSRDVTELLAVKHSVCGLYEYLALRLLSGFLCPLSPRPHFLRLRRRGGRGTTSKNEILLKCPT